MCEANAYLIKDGSEELIMKSVDILRPEETRIYIQDIFWRAALGAWSDQGDEPR